MPPVMGSKKRRIPWNKGTGETECTCRWCGKVFHRYPSVVKGGHAHYCSRHCVGKHMVQKRQRLDIRKWFRCAVCGHSFFRAPGLVSYSAGHCCSKTCAEKAARRTQVRCKCIVCDKIFYVYKSNARGKNRGIYCSMACLGKGRMGSKNPVWRGGISFEPYDSGFTKVLKREIRERDGHRCMICGRPEKRLSERLGVHRIDYDKENSHPWNLISLCKRCHTTTGYHRLAWIEFFHVLNEERGFKPEILRRKA